MQAEVEENNVSKKDIVPETSDVSTHVGYVNTAFEDGPKTEDKVNDKHDVRIPIHISNIIIVGLYYYPFIRFFLIIIIIIGDIYYNISSGNIHLL